MNTTTYTRSTNRNLKAEGYRLFPSQISPSIIDVVKPNQTTYRVDLAKGACDCAAGKRGVACCHLREAAKERRTIETSNRPKPGTEAYRKMVAADFD